MSRVRAEIREDLAGLANTLGEIARQTGKDGARLVADATVQFLIGGNGVIGMAKRTRDYAPAKGAITADAAARGWRVKIAHRAAMVRAERERTLTGNRSLYRVRRSRESTKTAGLIRSGGLRLVVADRKTGAPVNARALRASRGAPAREYAYDAGIDSRTRTGRFAKYEAPKEGALRNTVALNTRAAAVYYELKKREGSRAYVASSYAFKGISALRGAAVLNAQAQARSASGKATGLVTYRSDGKSSAIATITNLIPMKRRDLDAASALTLRAVLRDKEAYLSRKLAENFTRAERRR